MSSLEKTILNTITYFDTFDYPLNLFEVWKWLLIMNNDELKMNEEIKVSDVLKTLEENEELKRLVATKGGFYFLKGREEIIKIRLERYLIADRKFKKALKYIKNYFRYLPNIKFIGICNTLAFSHSRDSADIDFFIITKRGKIWSVREQVVLLAEFHNLRPKKGVTKDKFCFSFFIDEDYLNLENLALKPQDHYLIYWINQIIPVLDEDNLYEKFLEANIWTKRYLPNAFSYQVSDVRKVAAIPPGFKYTFLTSEKFSKFWQKKIMAPRLKSLANKDTKVIVSDTMLKFHDNDRRSEIREKFEERIKA